MPSKSEIRTIVKEKMFQFKNSEKIIFDQKISDKMFNLKEYKMAKTISSYVSKDKEVDTINIINKSLNIGKNVCVPLVIKNNNFLEMRKVQSINDLKTGSFNILEPKESTQVVNPKDIDIFLIPGIAFTQKGERIGRGGGYFDKFLSKCEGVKVGLAYEFQVFDWFPNQSHDIKMDILITENRTVICF